MKKAQIQSIQRVIRELKKLREKYQNDRDRYEVAENSAREQKEFWQGKVDDIQTQIEGHEKTLPKELELT
jgi:SMC interacting uncharacterized protein involved in chromosome segregation